MKLDCVLTSVNDNRLYLDFVPIFVKTWNKLYPDVEVKIVLISNNIPDDLLQYKENIILFNPIDNILTSFISQFIRLLYPCILNYLNGVLITDIDMLPMNRTYYTEPIKPYDNNKFIYYRENICMSYNQIAMCYNIATPNIWREIFGINSLEDIINKIKSIHNQNTILEGHGNSGWFIDQITLYNNVINWNTNTNNFISLKESDTKFKRLDRGTFNLDDINIKNDIKNGLYTDYHCYRPMSDYSNINYEIYELL